MENDLRNVALLGTAIGVVMLAGGCKPTGSDQASAPAPTTPAGATAEVVERAPALHPCAILADASVALAVAGAQAGQRADDDEAMGIFTCRWPIGA